jgi:hypothetical protein
MGRRRENGNKKNKSGNGNGNGGNLGLIPRSLSDSEFRSTRVTNIGSINGNGNGDFVEVEIENGSVVHHTQFFPKPNESSSDNRSAELKNSVVLPEKPVENTSAPSQTWGDYLSSWVPSFFHKPTNQQPSDLAKPLLSTPERAAANGSTPKR